MRRGATQVLKHLAVEHGSLGLTSNLTQVRARCIKGVPTQGTHGRKIRKRDGKRKRTGRCKKGGILDGQRRTIVKIKNTRGQKEKTGRMVNIGGKVSVGKQGNYNVKTFKRQRFTTNIYMR